MVLCLRCGFGAKTTLKVCIPWGILMIRFRGWVLCRDVELAAVRADGVRAGRELGILDVLRFNRSTLSAAKFEESRREYGYDMLVEKYPREVGAMRSRVVRRYTSE